MQSTFCYNTEKEQLKQPEYYLQQLVMHILSVP